MAAEKTRYLRRGQASEHLKKRGVSRTHKTLAKLAVTGGGPKFCKDGRIPLYTEEWLDAWVDAQLTKPVFSTSEIAALRRKAADDDGQGITDAGKGAVP